MERYQFIKRLASFFFIIVIGGSFLSCNSHLPKLVQPKLPTKTSHVSSAPSYPYTINNPIFIIAPNLTNTVITNPVHALNKGKKEVKRSINIFARSINKTHFEAMVRLLNISSKSIWVTYRFQWKIQQQSSTSESFGPTTTKKIETPASRFRWIKLSPGEMIKVLDTVPKPNGQLTAIFELTDKPKD